MIFSCFTPQDISFGSLGKNCKFIPRSQSLVCFEWWMSCLFFFFLVCVIRICDGDTRTSCTPFIYFQLNRGNRTFSILQAKNGPANPLPGRPCDLYPVTPRSCVFRRRAAWHVGPILVTMTIAFDGKL